MISFGAKVAILPCSEYENRFVKWTGVVCKWHRESNKMGIKFDSLKNPYSNEGLFWFHEDHLAIIHDTATRWWMRSPTSLYCGNPMSIRRVIFNGTKTIVLWGDGSKTIVSCGEDDQFDPYAGFCAAVTKKMFGSTRAAKKAIEPFIPTKLTEAAPDETHPLYGLFRAFESLNKNKEDT